MILFYHPEITSEQGTLGPEESRHSIKVLRKKVGDAIWVTDGRGNIYESVITEANERASKFEVKRAIKQEPPNFSIHLAIAPTKNLDRMEWMVEKCTEIGIQRIEFMQTKHSERKVIKTERLIKKAISAMTQSGTGFFT